jgi:CRP-like cAMP-binding protein
VRRTGAVAPATFGATGRERTMKSDRELIERLKKVPLFEGLSDRELRDVEDRGRIVEHRAGHEIVQEGRETAAAFHLILEGTASVLQHGGVRSHLGPGDYFGEISLLDGKPRSATVKTESPVRTFALAATSFDPLLDKFPELSRKLLRGLCAHVRAMEADSASR